ncbi:MAG: DUF4055 domain-containing protein [Gallionella sp.]|nr:DUF4055 domain-containing protein [Gallionella sp.]
MPVNSTHRDYKRMLPKWERCRDLAAGSDAVREAGEKYLPKLKDQPVDSHTLMLKRATLYNAFWRTIAGLLGMIFRQPPKIEVPEAVKPLLEDVDAAGQPFQLFLQDVAEEALEQGRLAVLVDYPTAPEGITQADAIQLNLRPTMQLYNTFSLLNWRTGRVNNQTVLVHAVLEETEMVVDPEDQYVEKEEERWRVLDLVDAEEGKVYRQQVFKMAKGQAVAKNAVVTFVQVGSDVFPKMNNKPLDFIPLVIMGTDDVGTDVDDPPLIDLVDMGYSHYRTSATYEQCLYFSPPTLFLSGFKPENPGDKVYVGSGTAIITPNENADGKFIEYTGNGLAPLEKALERKEQMMAVLGARMLEPQKLAVETAQTASIHRKGEESMLASVAQAISLGMTKATKWFVEWAGADPKDALVELNRDFYPARMTSADLMAQMAAWQSGGLSDQEFFANLQQGELIAQDVTLEEHQAQIEARQQQLADQQAAAQAAFADQNAGGGGAQGQ